MREATLIEIKTYFGMTMQEMKNEYSPLSTEDKAYFKQAVGEELEKGV